jgi:hypothetical protein
MGKIVLLIAAGIAIFLVIRWASVPREELTPDYNRMMEFYRRAKKDFEGEAGQKARKICSQRLGTGSANTAQQVLRLYGKDRADEFANCLSREWDFERLPY